MEEGSRGSGRGGCVCPPPPVGTPSAADEEEEDIKYLYTTFFTSSCIIEREREEKGYDLVGVAYLNLVARREEFVVAVRQTRHPPANLPHSG